VSAHCFWFQRVLLPGVVAKAMAIGGDDVTGRERNSMFKEHSK